MMLSPAFWEEQRKSRYAISPPFSSIPPLLYYSNFLHPPPHGPFVAIQSTNDVYYG